MKLPSLITGLVVGSLIGYFISNEFKRNSHPAIIQSSDSTKWHWTDSLDAVKAAPHNHKVIFENDKIRILNVILEPYEFEQMHTHRFPGVMFGPATDTSQFDIIYYQYGYDSVNHKYFVRDSTRQHSGGSSSDTSYTADLMRPEGPHRIKNLSNVRIDVFRVEFKTDKKNNYTFIKTLQRKKSYSMEREYKYMAYFFLAFVFFAGLGFYYPYFSLFPDFKSVTSTVHIHAIALLLWVLILITQPFLIAYKKFTVHRLIGRFTYFLMPVIIVSSIGVLRQQYYEGVEHNMTPVTSFKTLFTSLMELVSILIYYSLAMLSILKGNVAFHMRYMICLSLEFIPPSLGRTLGYWFYMKQYHTYNISILFCIAILITLIFYDKKKNLNSKPYTIALSLFLITQICWYVIGHPI